MDWSIRLNLATPTDNRKAAGRAGREGLEAGMCSVRVTPWKLGAKVASSLLEKNGMSV